MDVRLELEAMQAGISALKAATASHTEFCEAAGIAASLECLALDLVELAFCGADERGSGTMRDIARIFADEWEIKNS